MPLWRSALIEVCVVLVLSACGDTNRIRTVQDVPSDVSAIVDEAWRDLEEQLPWAAACMLPVEVFLSRDVTGGAAAYRPDEQLIEIQIPTSPVRFRESLVHELGHHIDATCPELDALRDRFRSAQSFDENQAWNTGDTWESTPAEHFAEAVVAIVTGNRINHDDVVVLQPAALTVVSNGDSE